MEYTLKLKAEQIQILSAGLGKLPFEVVAQLIAEIQKQLTEQEKPQQVEE